MKYVLIRHIWPSQVALLSAELEQTRAAAKGDMRLLSVELQGLREQQAALRRQQEAAQVRAPYGPLCCRQSTNQRNWTPQFNPHSCTTCRLQWQQLWCGRSNKRRRW